MFVFDLKQLGIDVEVKYFDFTVVAEKAATPGEPYDVILNGWQVDYADPAGFFVPLLTGNQSNANLDDDPALNARIAVANRLDGDARRNA